MRVQEKTKVGEYMVVDTVAGLVALVQMGVLEIHTWNTCAGHVAQPDRVVFDIDPGEPRRRSRRPDASAILIDYLRNNRTNTSVARSRRAPGTGRRSRHHCAGPSSRPRSIPPPSP